METIISRLLDAGYRVEFTSDPAEGIVAIVDDHAAGVFDGIAATPEAALLAAMPDCECGHAGPEHDQPSPDVDGLRGGRMCARDDCGCLTYRPAL